MPKIRNLKNDENIKGNEKLVGTDTDTGFTLNFPISAIKTFIGGEANLGYAAYTALLNQTGTAAPVATVLQNTTGGTFTWTRQSAGNYTITASSALFTVNKTIAFGNQGNETNDYWRWNRTSDTTLNLIVATDNRLINGSFEIRIYS